MALFGMSCKEILEQLGGLLLLQSGDLLLECMLSGTRLPHLSSETFHCFVTHCQHKTQTMLVCRGGGGMVAMQGRRWDGGHAGEEVGWWPCRGGGGMVAMQGRSWDGGHAGEEVGWWPCRGGGGMVAMQGRRWDGGHAGRQRVLVHFL